MVLRSRHPGRVAWFGPLYRSDQVEPGFDGRSNHATAPIGYNLPAALGRSSKVERTTVNGEVEGSSPSAPAQCRRESSERAGGRSIVPLGYPLGPRLTSSRLRGRCQSDRPCPRPLAVWAAYIVPRGPGVCVPTRFLNCYRRYHNSGYRRYRNRWAQGHPERRRWSCAPPTGSDRNRPKEPRISSVARIPHLVYNAPPCLIGVM